MQSKFPSSRLALWVAVAAAWPLQGLAAAGLVQFVTGEVQLRRGAAEQAATKGAEVESGDVIVTGPAGRAQIRFSDGGLVALYPDSQFTVTRYADAGNAAGAGTAAINASTATAAVAANAGAAPEDHFAVSLLRGGMRAVTGLIGKRDPRNYKVTTPTAVVGIRGSAFLIAFNADGELVVSGEQDEIEVCTDAGCVGVKAGESVRVVSGSQLPLYTHTRAVLPLPPPPVPFVMGETLGDRLSTAPAVPVPPPIGSPAPSVPPPGPAAPPPPATTVPAPDPSVPPVPPPPVTGTPGQPPSTRPPGTTAPPATPPTRPPIVVLPPIVRPVIVLPPIRLPPPPPPVIR
ncbi:FecR domain-containing protein [Acidovorax sp. sic0104]|uniref:FecR family protein n=1 Tax=Acidovorax sp. sic0104 TaxID=2854784 RepID=UPI001C460F32|nr:FecR family protein [Acidovorax sp. sic0104]MBV7540701.1 FecR family protein [Acidovorax sp. sic0104]